jgi:hypothetical protein
MYIYIQLLSLNLTDLSPIAESKAATKDEFSKEIEAPLDNDSSNNNSGILGRNGLIF